MIRSGRASFRAWRVPAAMLPALPSSSTRCLESRWNCSKRLRPQSRASASCSIPIHLLITSAAAPGGGLIVAPDAYTLVHRDLIVQSTAQHRIPAIYSYRQLIKEGGLMSYGPETSDIFRRSASYVDRILKGANPAELPAQAPAKFEVAINLKTATTLGLTVPPTVIALADEVIE